MILPSILLPRRHADLICRRRLQEKLLKLKKYKLVLVTAPAGYGKTSLLVDFAHAVDMPACWYTINKYDQDFRRFLAHFTSALLRVFPDFAVRSRTFIEEPQAACPDPNAAAIILVNELHLHVSDHFIFILDDFHLASDNLQITGFISQFIQHVGDHCHLYLASRRQVDLPDLDTLVARSQATSLPLADLQFTGQEIQLLALRKYDLHLSDQIAGELARQSEGWITALLLADETTWQGKIDVFRQDGSTGVSLARYWDHFLMGLPSPLRSFLLYTSIMDEFDAQLCAALLEEVECLPGADWRSLVQIVLQENLFVTAVGEGERTWLRYHALFQEYLQNRLEQAHPHLKARLLRRLAEIYAGQDEWERAYDAALRLGDLQVVLDMIERSSPYMVRYARYETLNRWLEPIPPVQVAACPCLLSLQGTLTTLGNDVPRSLELLNQAEAALRNGGSHACLARTLLRRSSAYHFLGDFPPALADAEEAFSLVENDPDEQALKAQALRARGTSLGSLGHPDRAIANLEQSLALYQNLEDAPNVASLQKELGIAYRKAGRLDAADRVYQASLNYWRQAGSLHRLTDLLNNIGVMQHYAGRYEQACQSLDEALGVARQCSYPRLEAFTLASLGDVYGDLDAARPALAAYEQAEQIARRLQNRFLPLHLDLARANLARCGGDLQQAQDYLDAPRQDIQEYGDFDRGQWSLSSGCLALAAGETGHAVEHLQVAIQIFAALNLAIESSRASLYLASAYYRAGEHQEALAYLGQAFQAASRVDGSHTLVVQGRECRPLLKFAAQVEHYRMAARRLLEQVECFERQLPLLRRSLRRLALAVPFDAPALDIRLMGDTQIEIDGQPLTRLEWKSQKQREFLFYLLAHPEGRSRQALASALWVDCEDPKKRCENTIRAVKKVFGKPVVVFEKGRYYFNQALDYEYDVEAFLALIERARTEIDPGRRADLYRHAAAFYRGVYLEEVDGSWAMPLQAQLWHCWLDALLHLAGYHLERKEYPLTFDYCWRALGKESYLEAAHCLLMRAYAAKGDHTGLVRQYQLCEKALQKHLKTKPSAETTALYRELLRG